MDSKPNSNKCLFGIVFDYFFFFFPVKCFLKCDLLINYPSISQGLAEDVHTEIFHK